MVLDERREDIAYYISNQASKDELEEIEDVISVDKSIDDDEVDGMMNSTLRSSYNTDENEPFVIHGVPYKMRKGERIVDIKQLTEQKEKGKFHYKADVLEKAKQKADNIWTRFCDAHEDSDVEIDDLQMKMKLLEFTPEMDLSVLDGLVLVYLFNTIDKVFESHDEEGYYGD